ncbi:MAG: NAD(P)H-dependent oxidoreductase [Microlunatus sp.]|nr:NAD(P)H-dependent oxidoreductase [Microlunatus sp.]
MTATLRVVVINGSPHERSKTAALAEVALDVLADLLPITSERIDVYRLGPEFTGASEREQVPERIEAVLRLAEGADLLIAAAPVYRGSYPGLFKHFFDLVDQYALANKPVLLLATGGGDHHALVLDHALRPLFAFFQALTIPVGIFASSGDFDGTTLLSPRVYGRIELALADVAELLRSRATGAPKITAVS